MNIVGWAPKPYSNFFGPAIGYSRFPSSALLPLLFLGAFKIPHSRKKGTLTIQRGYWGTQCCYVEHFPKS